MNRARRLLVLTALISVSINLWVAFSKDYISTILDGGTIPIKGKNFNGYIFPGGYLWYPYFLPDPENIYKYPFAMTSYTPTISDVYRAEEIICSQLQEFAVKANGDNPECLNHLEDYDRQYLGLVKWDKYHTLFVNLVSKKYEQAPEKSMLPDASLMTCGNSYMPAVVGGAPGEYTIEILVDLANDKILLLNI